MTRERAFIAEMGVVSPFGPGVAKTRSGLAGGLSGIRPLSLFQTPGNIPHPVGQVRCQLGEHSISGFKQPVIEYRKLAGEFESASAVWPASREKAAGWWGSANRSRP